MLQTIERALIYLAVPKNAQKEFHKKVSISLTNISFIEIIKLCECYLFCSQGIVSPFPLMACLSNL